MKIGTWTEKEVKGRDGAEKRVVDMEFSIPFLKSERFGARPNKIYADGNEKAPAFDVVTPGGVNVGGLWERSNDNGKFLSGNIQSPVFPGGKLDFLVFFDREQPGKGILLLAKERKSEEAAA